MTFEIRRKPGKLYKIAPINKYGTELMPAGVKAIALDERNGSIPVEIPYGTHVMYVSTVDRYRYWIKILWNGKLYKISELVLETFPSY